MNPPFPRTDDYLDLESELALVRWSDSDSSTSSSDSSSSFGYSDEEELTRAGEGSSYQLAGRTVSAIPSINPLRQVVETLETGTFDSATRAETIQQIGSLVLVGSGDVAESPDWSDTQRREVRLLERRLLKSLTINCKGDEAREEFVCAALEAVLSTPYIQRTEFYRDFCIQVESRGRAAEFGLTPRGAPQAVTGNAASRSHIARLVGQLESIVTAVRMRALDDDGWMIALIEDIQYFNMYDLEDSVRFSSKGTRDLPRVKALELELLELLTPDASTDPDKRQRAETLLGVMLETEGIKETHFYQALLGRRREECLRADYGTTVQSEGGDPLSNNTLEHSLTAPRGGKRFTDPSTELAAHEMIDTPRDIDWDMAINALVAESFDFNPSEQYYRGGGIPPSRGAEDLDEQQMLEMAIAASLADVQPVQAQTVQQEAVAQREEQIERLEMLVEQLRGRIAEPTLGLYRSLISDEMTSFDFAKLEEAIRQPVEQEGGFTEEQAEVLTHLEARFRYAYDMLLDILERYLLLGDNVQATFDLVAPRRSSELPRNNGTVLEMELSAIIRAKTGQHQGSLATCVKRYLKRCDRVREKGQAANAPDVLAALRNSEDPNAAFEELYQKARTRSSDASDGLFYPWLGTTLITHQPEHALNLLAALTRIRDENARADLLDDFTRAWINEGDAYFRGDHISIERGGRPNLQRAIECYEVAAEAAEDICPFVHNWIHAIVMSRDYARLPQALALFTRYIAGDDTAGVGQQIEVVLQAILDEIDGVVSPPQPLSVLVEGCAVARARTEEDPTSVDEYLNHVAAMMKVGICRMPSLQEKSDALALKWLSEAEKKVDHMLRRHVDHSRANFLKGLILLTRSQGLVRGCARAEPYLRAAHEANPPSKDILYIHWLVNAMLSLGKHAGGSQRETNNGLPSGTDRKGKKREAIRLPHENDVVRQERSTLYNQAMTFVLGRNY